MAKSEQQRQKKLQRKAAKQKAKRRELKRRESLGLPARLREAASCPIVDCRLGEAFFDQGMAQLLVSRRLPGGQIAFALFLIDRYCLGVKNAFAKIDAAAEYAQVIEQIEEVDNYLELEPAEARALVDDAVAFAASYGFSPHPDYRQAKGIFGDVDAETASRRFDFGKDGKAVFIQGPNDSMEDTTRILNQLAIANARMKQERLDPPADQGDLRANRAVSRHAPRAASDAPVSD